MIELTPNNNTVIKHLRPGYIIPKQDLAADKINTNFIPTSTVSLLINRDSDKFAKGSLLIDNGIETKDLEQNLYEYYRFTATSNSLMKETVVTEGTDQPKQLLKEIVFLDYDTNPEVSMVNFACLVQSDGSRKELAYYQDSNLNSLTLSSKDEAQEGIDVTKMKAIYFGVREDEAIAALCGSAVSTMLPDPYTVENIPDLSKPSIDFVL